MNAFRRRGAQIAPDQLADLHRPAPRRVGGLLLAGALAGALASGAIAGPASAASVDPVTGLLANVLDVTAGVVSGTVGSLTGTLTDASGSPLAGAIVTVSALSPDGVVTVDAATTDAKGGFSIDLLSGALATALSGVAGADVTLSFTGSDGAPLAVVDGTGLLDGVEVTVPTLAQALGIATPIAVTPADTGTTTPTTATGPGPDAGSSTAAGSGAAATGGTGATASGGSSGATQSPAAVLGIPVLSRKVQIFGQKKTAKRVTVTVAVSGATSGSVRFVSGSTVLATAPVSAGRARATLPKTLTAKTYRALRATYVATAGAAASSSPSVGPVRVKKAKLVKRLRLTGAKAFAAGSRPLLHVKLAKLSNGARAHGRLVVKVAGAKVGMVKGASTQKRALRIRLAKHYRHDVRVRVRFVGTPKRGVASSASKTVTLHTR